MSSSAAAPPFPCVMGRRGVHLCGLRLDRPQRRADRMRRGRLPQASTCPQMCPKCVRGLGRGSRRSARHEQLSSQTAGQRHGQLPERTLGRTMRSWSWRESNLPAVLAAVERDRVTRESVSCLCPHVRVRREAAGQRPSSRRPRAPAKPCTWVRFPSSPHGRAPAQRGFSCFRARAVD